MLAGERKLYPSTFKASPAGTPYRPSNGHEGELFDDLWCAGCAKDAKYRKTDNPDGACPIIVYAMGFEIGDPEYPPEWQWGEDGQPVCTAFEKHVPGEPPKPKPYRCSETPDLFGAP